jgi:hypothetical protein
VSSLLSRARPLGPRHRSGIRRATTCPYRNLKTVDRDQPPGADSEEKHGPVSDIDTVVVDSLKALDPEWPIREADIARRGWHGRASAIQLVGMSVSGTSSETGAPCLLPCALA